MQISSDWFFLFVCILIKFYLENLIETRRVWTHVRRIIRIFFSFIREVCEKFVREIIKSSRLNFLRVVFSIRFSQFLEFQFRLFNRVCFGFLVNFWSILRFSQALLGKPLVICQCHSSCSNQDMSEKRTNDSFHRMFFNYLVRRKIKYSNHRFYIRKLRWKTANINYS